MGDITLTCKGCATSYFCDMIMNGTTDGCPCKTCLVKFVCFENCDGFCNSYWNIFGFEPAKNKGW